LAKADPETWLFPLVESSLPEESLRVWQRSSLSEQDGSKVDPPRSKLSYLLEFMEKEVKNEQQISLARAGFKEVKSDKKEDNKSKKKWSSQTEDIPTAASLHVSSEAGCIFCGWSNHQNWDCFTARKMTIDERRDKAKEMGCCFLCLKVGHHSSKCKSAVRCFMCNKGHQTLMCPQSERATGKKDEGYKKKEFKPKSEMERVTEGVKTLNASYSTEKEELILMKTLLVRVKGRNAEEKEVRLLFDDGSQRSCIKSSLAEFLDCENLGDMIFQNSLFGGNLSEVKRRSKFRVQLRGSCAKYASNRKEATLINEHVLARACPYVPQGPWIQELAKKKIYLTDTKADSMEVQILIGSDLWGSCVTGKMVRLESGLTAVETIFGWTLSGEVIVQPPFQQSCASIIISMHSQEEKSLPELWQLETIGIMDTAEKISQEQHDLKIKKEFQDNIKRNQDGRYIIKLPWVCESNVLHNNKFVAEKRLNSATRKLVDQSAYETYNKILEEWGGEGIIEMVQSRESKASDGHYLPHRPIFKPDSRTTPVRPVFDASCRTGSSPSLNDCLEKGPNLLEIIPSLLLRFREKRVGVLSDIRKAFSMIEVDEEDRNFLKFLWWEDADSKTLKIYRHSRVMFGLNCGPFILAAVLEYHLENVEESEKEIAAKLLKSLYVDNSVISFNTAQEYEEFKSKSTEILARAKMDLRQWETNIEKSCDQSSTSVLGLKWDKEEDLLHCQLPKRMKEEKGFKVTKRNVLSFVAQVFDPIGFTAPAVLQPKIQLQESWNLDLKWDTEWEETEGAKFIKWCEEIENLAKIRIPRHAFPNSAGDIQIHCFTDASQSAYAAVVYARVIQDQKVIVQLLLAKSRLAPIDKKKTKRVTIPRLELLGCLVGSRLTNSIQRALETQDIPTIYWCDSTTALSWIRKDEDWGTFVGNRVREIRSLSNEKQWRFVPGALNPADLPSRGCSPKELLESRWWEGPQWLKQPEEFWPRATEIHDVDEIKSELRKTVRPALNVSEIPPPKFSTYLKNVRVSAWIRRFINLCRMKKKDRVKYQEDYPYLRFRELRQGELDIIQEIQKRHNLKDKKFSYLTLDKGEDGLIHVKTRLTYKDDWEQFNNPILLPNNDPLVEQLITYVHRIYHHGGTQFILNKLRQKFWIVQGRKTVGRIIRKCVRCKRYSSQKLTCNPAPLPLHRIETVAAFQTTGVDLAGPLVLKGGKKAWIVIYTCAVYRAVYLDWVDAISSDEFLDSLERFTNTVGRPSTICSDNGTNFVGANNLIKKLDWKKLQEKFHVKQIKWRFNPPTAAWWGGFWERLVRTVKDLLRKILGPAKLTTKELTSCLASVSYVINNGPLTTLNEDKEDLNPLTPFMFMRDLPIGGLPKRDSITQKDLKSAYKKIQSLKGVLKDRFEKEYLSQLIQKRSAKCTPPPKVGQLVLIGADNKKRTLWPLGRILELIPGKDGNIRVAKVKTKTGILLRPLPRLYPLEVPCEEVPISAEVKDYAKELNQNGGPDQELEEEEDSESEMTLNQLREEVEPVVTTRSGRNVKKPQRFGV
jgi:hypothetical protein